MKVSGNGGTFQQPQPGTMRAICTRIIDLGTQETTWQGKPKKARKVMLAFELDQPMADGRPFLQASRFTASIHEKSALGQLLEGWRGKAFSDEERDGFDLQGVLGKTCLLSLVQEGEYVNIKSAAKLMLGMQPMTPAGDLLHLDLDNFNPSVLAKLSPKLQETIGKSPEYAKVTGAVAAGYDEEGNAINHDADNDISF